MRLLLDLARNQNEGYISLKEVSERQDISRKYLEQIVIMLNQVGLLHANRGHQGGYRLALEPKDITVLKVLETTEDSVAPIACLKTCDNTCPRKHECDTLEMWEGLNHVIREYLGDITLQDLLDRSPKNRL